MFSRHRFEIASREFVLQNKNNVNDVMVTTFGRRSGNHLLNLVK